MRLANLLEAPKSIKIELTKLDDVDVEVLIQMIIDGAKPTIYGKTISGLMKQGGYDQSQLTYKQLFYVFKDKALYMRYDDEYGNHHSHAYMLDKWNETRWHGDAMMQLGGKMPKFDVKNDLNIADMPREYW